MRTAAEGGLAPLVKRGAINPLFRGEIALVAEYSDGGAGVSAGCGFLRCATKSANGVHVQLLDLAATNISPKAICKAILKAIDIRAVQGYFSLSDGQARTLHIAAKFVRLLPESARWGSGLCLLDTDHSVPRWVVPRHGVAR